jgi:hypothetical protein
MKVKNELNNQRSLIQKSYKKDSSKAIKKEIFFSHKSSLEKILRLIKKLQINYIFNAENDKKNTRIIKELLLSFKNKLINSMEDKQKIYDLKKDEKEKKKNEVKKNTWSEKDYSSETEQLKLLNFKIENKIKSIDFEIERKNIILTNEPIGQKAKETIINYNNKSSSKVTDLLVDNLILIQSYKENVIELRNETEKQINIISNKISEFKNINKNNLEIKDNSNKNNDNYNEASYILVKTTKALSDLDEDNNNIDYNKENKQQSFHSSLYTDSFSINKEEEFFSNKNNENIVNTLNLSNDNINTDNSNNNSEKTISFKEKRNLVENYIFANMSDNE